MKQHFSFKHKWIGSRNIAVNRIINETANLSVESTFAVNVLDSRNTFDHCEYSSRQQNALKSLEYSSTLSKATNSPDFTVKVLDARHARRNNIRSLCKVQSFHGWLRCCSSVCCTLMKTDNSRHTSWPIKWLYTVPQKTITFLFFK